jgi:hypothetical protein
VLAAGRNPVEHGEYRGEEASVARGWKARPHVRLAHAKDIEQVRHMHRALHRFGAGFMGGLLATRMAGSMVALAEQTAEELEMSDEAWFFRYRDPLDPCRPRRVS